MHPRFFFPRGSTPRLHLRAGPTSNGRSRAATLTCRHLVTRENKDTWTTGVALRGHRSRTAREGTMWAHTQRDTQTHVALTTLKQKQKTPAATPRFQGTSLLFGKFWEIDKQKNRALMTPFL